MLHKHLLIRSLGTLLQSGLSLTDAMASLSGTASGVTLRRTVNLIVQRLMAGDQLFEAMSDTHQFTRFEISLIKAGELSGCLDEALLKLAELLEMEQNTRRQIMYGLAYPMFLINAAILLPPLYVFVVDGLESYLWVVLPLLAGVWGIVFGAWLFSRKTGMFALSGWVVDGVWLSLPIVGGIIRKFIWARFLWVLEACYSAGINPQLALETAARACHNRYYEKDFLRASHGISQQRTIAETIAEYTSCPNDLRMMIATGEQSGTLDAMLQRGARLYQTQAEESLRRLLRVIPVVMLLIVGGFIGYVLIQFYSVYFSQLST